MPIVWLFPDGCARPSCGPSFAVQRGAPDDRDGPFAGTEDEARLHDLVVSGDHRRGASFPLVDYADLDGNLHVDNDPYSGVIVEAGKLILPGSAGLGLKPRG
jgi:hypothetical protein